ncbi:23S rRNA (adenine(2503)-C(2))-methyltransferase RlmN [Marinomonas sp. C2222]|uniref:Dual-specificity RNA methyltransferase RlmN n=1 Tax=Marinomonas sargassi TaxID=2984494 RepID=A0ABT2YRQ8_9GAMM|nr:23S rRNA (adenine(2503)-C(2))-methyltransferase RlmN [Marinomonas sargassi]MCV2402577.1 23S rRNA (adenine(2503)-C(2))-methyltransferase RlmN [Marinomonas sargassi]
MTDIKKVNLLGLSPQKLIEFFESIGEKKFRATQVMKWIHQKGAENFDEMTDVSKALRSKLEKISEIRGPEVVSQNISKDGTRKWIIRTEGGNNDCVETVLIPDGNRATLCVSSQVGCSLDCSFCSTGKQGFNRNLTPAEIIGQVWIAIKSFGPMDPNGPRRVTNVVMMGMGEPLMNFEPVVDSMILMMHDNAYGMSKRRVTLSTSGVVPKIYELIKRTDVSLAISLHAPNDELRDELVPINKRFPIAKLLEACQHYLENLPDKRHITIEYTLMSGVNDNESQAHELAVLLKDLECKINLIPFNPFPNSGYEKPSNNRTRKFQKILADTGYTVTVRTTRGDDIDAACGQLVGDFHDKTRRSQKYIELKEVNS